MASKIKVNLDTNKENYLVAKCKQNDDIKLEATIYENGLEKDLTSSEIMIQALKADNTYIIQDTDISKENNIITANLNRDFTRIAGTTKIEIVLRESGKQNTTFSFYLEVVGSVINKKIESENTVTILETLTNKVVEAVQVKQETEELITSGGAATKGEIQQVNSQLAEIDNKTATKLEVETERQRINQLTKLPTGSTTGDAELIDGRVGADGKVYTNIGSALRNQFKDLSNNISTFENSFSNGTIDIMSLYSWEKGYIHGDTGEYITLNNMYRTTEPKFINHNTITIEMVGSEYNLHVLTFNTDGTFEKNVDYINKDTFDLIIDKTKKYAFCLQYRINGTTVADLSTLKITVRNNAYYDIQKSKSDISSIEGKIASIGVKEKNIICFGDSLTYGAGGEALSPDGSRTNYPKVIETISGIKTLNYGVGGDDCHDIFARVGSEALVVNNITIPPEITKVNLGYPLKTILGNDFNSDIWITEGSKGGINPCRLGDVLGNITEDTFQGNYIFTRLETGESVTINRPTLITTKAMEDKSSENVYVFWVGQNGGYSDVDDWIYQIKQGIEFLGAKKYVVIACQTDQSYTVWEEKYNKFLKAFGSKFINLHKYLIDYGLTDANISPKAKDTENLSNGICPSSLKNDNVHFNHFGYTVIGTLIYRRLKELYPEFIM